MNRISRRRLLTAGAAAGMLVATGLPVQALPKRGGTLRLGLSGASGIETWDSRSHSNTFMIMAAHGAVFETLTQVSASGELVGELAVSWEGSNDAKLWTFKLRDGVVFHNGTPFTAQDVVASLELHQGGASPASPIVDQIAHMTVVSDHEVQLELVAPNIDLPFLLSDYHLCIYPAGQMAEALEKGIGTGLYRVDRFKAGEHVALERVKSHYKDGKEGWFDFVDLRAINNADERLAALQSGKVHVINDVPYGEVESIQQIGGVDLFETSGNQHLAIGLVNPKFEDNELSSAVKTLIDRSGFVAHYLNGRGVAGFDSPIGPANQFFCSDLACQSDDIAQAAKALRDAGLNRLSISGESAEQIARALSSPELDVHAVSGTADLKITKWAGRTTEDWMFSMGYQTGAAWNDALWDDASFQQKLLQARSELRGDKRSELYRDMQRQISAEGRTLVPAFSNFIGAKRANLVNSGQLGNVMEMDSGRLIERWWFA